jgi:hypothetical protein
VCKFEPDYGVFDEFFAEGSALVGVLHRLLITDSGKADALDYDTHAFVVEVRHDDCDGLVCGARIVTGKLVV